MNACKWLVVLVLVLASAATGLSWLDVPSHVRVGVVVCLGLLAFALAWSTTQGQTAWQFAHEARNELNKVVWPTRSETVRMTGVVSLVVVVVGLFLWLADAVFLKAVTWLTGL